MKKSLLAGASIGAILLATGAQAADMAVHKAPVFKAPPVAPWSWTGFYIGANVGVVAATNSVQDDPSSANIWLQPTGVVDHNDQTSVIGGVEAGANWQISNVVLGAEADISFAALSRSSSVLAGGGSTATYSSSLDWLSTVRGRLGLAFDRVLIYGTGGVAFADLKGQLSDPANPFVASPGSSVTGWTAGGGVEYAFTDHWTAKAEYLHVGFADQTVTVAPGGTSYTFKFKDALDIGRVGINYKF